MTVPSPTTAAKRSGDKRSSSAFAGTWTLLRFALRRDRIRIPVWALSISLMSMAALVAIDDSFEDPASVAQIEVTMSSPAIVAITGPNYAPGEYTLGVMMGQRMLVWTLIAVAIMSIMLIVRHTRTEEATGRAELVRSAVVGRHAPSFAAYQAVAAANLAVAAAVTLALGSAGANTIDWSGSILYGAAHFATGLFFASVALVAVQISEFPRGVIGMGIGVVGVAFALRSAGDVADNGLSWVSPLGWGQATHVFHTDRWWPLVILLVGALVLALLAAVLSTRRGVGAGLRAPRPSPATASSALTHPFGFAMRMQRGMVIGWSAGLFALGLTYGSVLPEMETFIEQFEELGAMFTEAGGATIMDSFVATIVMVLAVFAAASAVLSAQRLRSEEVEGRAEPMLVAGLPRRTLYGAYVASAVVTTTVVMLAGALGFGLAGAAVVDGEVMRQTMLAAAGFIPALWVVSAVGFALVGIAPKLTAWVWALVAYSFVTVYLGPLLNLPAWTANFTPLGHPAQYPAEEWTWWPLLILTALAVLLIATGAVAFRRRDLQSTV
jgi:ABC-2 type transport system permease protein